MHAVEVEPNFFCHGATAATAGHNEMTLMRLPRSTGSAFVASGYRGIACRVHGWLFHLDRSYTRSWIMVHLSAIISSHRTIVSSQGERRVDDPAIDNARDAITDPEVEGKSEHTHMTRVTLFKPASHPPFELTLISSPPFRAFTPLMR